MLENITIPDAVIKIKNSAFRECTSLKNIKIPDSVVEMEDSVFQDCTSLTEISFSENLTSIGLFAFSGTPWFNNHDGLVCDGKYLFGYSGTMPENMELIVPDNIQVIADGAFWRKSLGEVTISENVISVGKEAFAGCTDLKNVTVLNPDCILKRLAITNTLDTRPMDFSGSYEGTVTGYKNSSAQAYVNDNYNMGTFVSLGEMPFTLGDVTINDDIDARDAAAVLVLPYDAQNNTLSYLKKSADVNKDKPSMPKMPYYPRIFAAVGVSLLEK